ARRSAAGRLGSRVHAVNPSGEPVRRRASRQRQIRADRDQRGPPARLAHSGTGNSTRARNGRTHRVRHGGAPRGSVTVTDVQNVAVNGAISDRIRSHSGPAVSVVAPPDTVKGCPLWPRPRAHNPIALVAGSVVSRPVAAPRSVGRA